VFVEHSLTKSWSERGPGLVLARVGASPNGDLELLDVALKHLHWFRYNKKRNKK
jgi:hypothetical protein